MVIARIAYLKIRDDIFLRNDPHMFAHSVPRLCKLSVSVTIKLSTSTLTKSDYNTSTNCHDLEIVLDEVIDSRAGNHTWAIAR
jgi:hypothetical protein